MKCLINKLTSGVEFQKNLIRITQLSFKAVHPETCEQVLQNHCSDVIPFQEIKNGVLLIC